MRSRGRAEAPPAYHVFGASGEQEMVVELLSGRRVVGSATEGVLGTDGRIRAFTTWSVTRCLEAAAP